MVGGVSGSSEEVSPGVAEGLEEVMGGVAGKRKCHQESLKDWRKWCVEFQEVQRKYHQESLKDWGKW